MTQLNFDRLSSAAADSLLWRSLLAVMQAYASAWSGSSLGRVWRTMSDQASTWTAATRVRYIALVIAWIAAWQFVVLSLLPPYVLSGLPRVWFAALAVGAIVIAIAAPAFARAWPASALATMNDKLNQKV